MNTNYFSKIRILDGGMGQHLLAKGLKPKGSLWSATALIDKKHHQLIVDAHLDFIKSGAEVIITNNFSARRARMIQNNVEKHFNYANDVLITCPLHGDFKQNPNGHLFGSGCPTCGILARAEKKTKSTEQFIKEAILIHKDTYKYDNVDYKSATENVSITCSIHGEFLQ